MNVQVIDINDNVPTFVYPESSKRFVKNVYYGAIASDKEIGSTVLQIRADDLDGGKLGDVRYELTDDYDKNSTEGQYFAVDSKTGIVKTLRTLTDIPPRSLPFRLVVTARDNPGATNPSDYNTAQAHVVVSVNNIIYPAISQLTITDSVSHLIFLPLASTLQEFMPPSLFDNYLHVFPVNYYFSHLVYIEHNSFPPKRHTLSLFRRQI